MKNSIIFLSIFLFSIIIIFSIYSNEASSKELIKKADILFSERHKTEGKYIPNQKSVKYAMAYYQKAFGNDPKKANNIEACWKYLQAVFFYSTYIIKDGKSKAFLNSKYTEYCIPMLKNYPKSGELAMISSMILGKWAEIYGILEAMKSNVHNELKKLIEKAIKYSPKFREGDPYRAFGMLMLNLPDIVSWKSIKKAKEYFEKSLDYSNKGSYNWKYSNAYLALIYSTEYPSIGISKNQGNKKAIQIIKEIEKCKIDIENYTEDSCFIKKDLAQIKKKIGIR